MAKADPTLVKASMIEAKTRAASNVSNMKPLFDATTEISKGYLTQVQDIMKTFKDEKEKQRLALEKQMEPFMTSADNAFTSIFELKEPLPDAVINMFEREVNKLQDQFEMVNSIGEGDTRENRKARAKIMGELTKLKNSTLGLRKEATEVLFNIKEGNVNTSVVDPATLDPANMVLDLKNLDKLADEGKVKVTYGKDGAVFTVKDYYSDATSVWGDEISFTMSDLNEAFPPKDTKIDGAIMSMNTASGKKGVFDGTGEDPVYNYEVQGQRGFLMDMIKDKKDFKNISRRRVEGLDIPSFEESLMDNVDISFGVLDKMFYMDNGERVEIGQAFKYLDYNNDGKINNDDSRVAGVDAEVFKGNVAAMIDAVVNPDNPAFSLSVSKELFADYYVGTENTKGIDHQIYEKNYNLKVQEKIDADKRSRRNNGSSKPGNYRVNDRDMNPASFHNTFDETIEFLENPKEQTLQLPSGRFVKYENGKWYGQRNYDDGTNEWILTNYGDIAQVEGIRNYVKGANELSNEGNNDYSGKVQYNDDNYVTRVNKDQVKVTDLHLLSKGSVIETLNYSIAYKYDRIEIKSEAGNYMGVYYDGEFWRKFGKTTTGIKAFLEKEIGSEEWNKHIN
jgi:hypothetical protein